MPNLEKYSKADLIWVINQLCKFRFLAEYHVRAALNELDYRKEMELLEAADRYTDLAFRKKKEYVELMKPYEGKPIKDIPKDVLNRAYQLAEDIKRANSMYMKIHKKID